MADVIGFGEPSRRATTVNMNFFSRFTTTPVKGGCDVTVDALKGLTFEDGSKSVTLHMRKDWCPRPGQRVMVGGRLVKVKRTKREDGRLKILDEDSGGWLTWEG